VEKMGVPVVGSETGLGDASLLVDALLGYGSKGSPREPVSGIIKSAKGSKVPVLAVDIPSGLDATTGEPGEPTMAAKATVTFGLPKTGFLNPKARGYVGELYLADISMPKKIYASYSVTASMFSGEQLLRIW